MEAAGPEENFYEQYKQNAVSMAKVRTHILVDLNFYHDSTCKYVFLSLEGLYSSQKTALICIHNRFLLSLMVISKRTGIN